MSTGRAKGVPEQYPTAGKPPLASDNAAFASSVAGSIQQEPVEARHRIEGGGARLTVSPSMKVPQESPVPTQGGGRPVPSSPSRQGSFSSGQGDAFG